MEASHSTKNGFAERPKIKATLLFACCSGLP